MTDIQIVELFWERSETAIRETEKRYGSYCKTIAMNILHNKEDAEECVNDTYLGVWNAIPTERPLVFSTFIGRIARNLSLDRYKRRKAKRRKSNETALLLSELEGCVPSPRGVEEEVETRVLAEAIDRFLSDIKEEDMMYFIRRYWYADSVADVAERFGAGESKVKVSLHRTRGKLKDYLEKEGIQV